MQFPGQSERTKIELEFNFSALLSLCTVVGGSGSAGAECEGIQVSSRRQGEAGSQHLLTELSEGHRRVMGQ